jgi:aminopeptidase N
MIMKKTSLILLLLAFLSLTHAQENIKPSCRNHKANIKWTAPTEAEMQLMESMAFRSDTFDILHYSIQLDEVDYSHKSIKGSCEISFTPLMDDQNAIHLDLLNLPVDSVKSNGNHLDFVYDSIMVHIYFNELLNKGDTNRVKIWYGGFPTIDPSGFGGFDFQDGYAYNLGIGLASIPHNYGRGWFPCFDNFVERATFDFYVTTLTTQFAYCVGNHISTDSIAPGLQLFHYSMEQPITTYHAAVAVADYAMTRSSHEGLEKEIPVELVSKPQDTTKFKNSFAFLHEAIEALEQWYGPYNWERVGYVITTRGAMEHPTCVAYPASLGLNENPYNNMDIMSHELAHHWFGNITTLTTAYDMWIKEGTSEYGYHLFTKEFLGDEEFYDLIADNQFDVIENAHKADEDFRALSGMPMEFTYGLTTYQKGAAVIHNMHSYLGDSLFKQGVRSILDTYAFSHCDAGNFENTLSASTGKDMSDFFKDWIYAPGFSAFEIDSVKTLPVGDQFEVSLFIEQKLFHAPHYHTRVPMKISFYDADWNKHDRLIELDGQYSEVSLTLDFEPVFQFLNHQNFLNNGQLSYIQVIKEADDYNFKRSKLELDVESVTDSLLLFVEHVWGAPDPIKRTDLDIDLSDNHYWIVDGMNPSNALMSTKFYYAGNNSNELDFDLTADTEKDIILLYRRDAGEDWVEYPYATKNVFIPTDSKGFFIVDSLLLGQYCFGNGDYFAVNNKDEIAQKTAIDLYPNPSTDQVIISIADATNISSYEMYDIHGRICIAGRVDAYEFMVELAHLPGGNYFIALKNKSNEVVKTIQVSKME